VRIDAFIDVFAGGNTTVFEEAYGKSVPGLKRK
jgi:hypothetical protein